MCRTLAPVIGRPLPVFRLDFSVWALRRRPRNAIDRWDGVTYRRLIVLEGRPSELAVHLEIITSFPGDFTPVRGDAMRLQQIVENLV